MFTLDQVDAVDNYLRSSQAPTEVRKAFADLVSQANNEQAIAAGFREYLAELRERPAGDFGSREVHREWMKALESVGVGTGERAGLHRVVPGVYPVWRYHEAGP